MTRLLLVSIVAIAAILAPAPAAAQNRQELQMMADMRLLQEQVGKLQLALNQLAEQANATQRRVDDQAGANVKAFANQQLLINTLSSTVNTVREKLDDNTVRVSQLTQELAAIRSGLSMLTEQLNTLVGLLQPATSPDGAAGTPGPSTGPLASVNVPPSPARYYDLAFADYASDRLDSAIEGFTEFLQKFPDAPQAPSAAYFIGEAYYHGTKFKEAIDAYRRVVTQYKGSDRAPDALFMIGVCYSALKQNTNARNTFEEVRKQYPDSPQALQAEQKLRGMGVIR